jgi:magnesium transporter
MIVDRAVYRDGRRAAEPDDFAGLHAACQTEGAVAWLGLYEPSSEEFSSAAREFDLHELAVEDAVKAHQRPKLERYGDTLFLVLKPARYVDETETVLFGEVAIFVGPQFVITVRHGDAPELGPVRRRLEARPDLLRRGALAIAYAIVDHVVDGYQPVVAGLQNDVDEIEDEVFGASPTVSRRIYELTREVIEFQRATSPLDGILTQLIR